MIRNINYLLGILLRKKSIYIVFAISIITFTSVLYATLRDSTTNSITSEDLFPINFFVKLVSYIFTTIFSVFIIARIFQSGRNDGTHILVLSKPITRKEIIAGKFIVLLAMITSFHILSFVFYAIITTIMIASTASTKPMSANLIFRFVGSMTVGSYIIALITAAIIVFIATFFSKMIISIISIIFATAIPIITFIAAPIAGAIAPSSQITKLHQAKYLLLETEKSKNDDGESIYNPAIQNFSDGMYFLSPSNQSTVNKNINNYEVRKYFDIWYQLGSFFDVFSPKKKFSKSYHAYTMKKASYDKVLETEWIKFENKARKATLKMWRWDPIKAIGTLSHECIGFFTKEQLNFEKNILPSIINNTRYQEIINPSNANNLKTIFKKINNLTNRRSKKGMITEIAQKISEEFKLKRTNVKYNQIKILLWRAIVDYQTKATTEASTSEYNNGVIKNKSLFDKMDFLNLNKVKPFFGNYMMIWQEELLLSSTYDLYDVYRNSKYSSISDLTANDIINDYKNFSLWNYLIHDGRGASIVKNYKEKHFLDPTPVFLVWTTIAIVLTTISIRIYLKRDFK